MADILILHGWGSCAKNWSRVKGFLEKKGCNVYVPDLPGFGENPVPPRPWSVDDYVKWVADYCTKNGFSDFFLVGHSFGGGIAVKFASVHPEKIKGLVLIDAAIIRMKTPKYYLSLILAKTGNFVLSVPMLSRLKPIVRKIFYKLAGTADYQKVNFDKINTMRETFKNVVNEDLFYCLPAIQARTLVVWGDKDDITPLRDGYRINGNLPNSKMEIVKGARHGINLEFPDIVSQKILNFINAQP